MTDGVGADEGGQAGYRLLAAASDSEEQSKACPPSLKDDAHDPDAMWHTASLNKTKSTKLLVSLYSRKGVLQNVRRLIAVGNLVVDLVLDVLGDVAEDERLGARLGVEFGDGSRMGETG